MSKIPATSRDIHPKEVARMFGVHLRTVFRWIKRGHLHSEKGLISGEKVTRTLSLWQSSTSKPEARKKLGNISTGTLRSWRDKGILCFVTVMGEERVTNNSIINSPDKKPKGPVTRSGYFGLSHLVDITGTSYKTVKIHMSDIAHENIDGRILIPEKEEMRIKSLFRNSCTVREASRILDIDKSSVRKKIHQGKFDSFSFLGITRIPLSSIEGFKKDKAANAKLKEIKLEQKNREKEKQLINKRLKKEASRRKKAEKKALVEKKKSVRAKPSVIKKEVVTKPKKTKMSPEPKITIPDYEPELLVKVVMGRKCNVTSITEASKTTRVDESEIHRLMSCGAIRYCEDEGERFPYISSLKAWVANKRKFAGKQQK